MPSRTTCESFQPSRRSSSRRSRSVCTSRRAWMIRDMSRSVYASLIVSHWPTARWDIRRATTHGGSIGGAPVDTRCRDNLCGPVHGKPDPAAVTDGETPAHARGGMKDQVRRAVRTLSVALFLLGWQGASMLNVRRQFLNLQKIMGRNRYQLQIDDALLVSMDSQTEFLHSVGFLRSAPKARTYVEPRFLREVDPGLVRIP